MLSNSDILLSFVILYFFVPTTKNKDAASQKTRETGSSLLKIEGN